MSAADTAALKKQRYQTIYLRFVCPTVHVIGFDKVSRCSLCLHHLYLRPSFLQM
jgi:hypothetical protein